MKKNTTLNPSSIAGIKINSPLMNAAYIHSKNPDDAELLIKSGAGAIVFGSITANPRKPNKNGGYWQHKEKLYALNSFGMPNRGLGYFKKELPKIVSSAHNNNKPLFANVAGFNNQEFIQLVQLAEDSGADAVELNLGCPNVWEGTEQKKIISYSPRMISSLLEDLSKKNFDIKIGLKISPLPPDILSEVSNAIIESEIISFVTATNSYPNAYFTTGTGKPSDVLTGMSGSSLKPISVGVVKQLRQLLPLSIDIIGCGGVSTISDVSDYLDAGATAVQIATGLLDNGLSLFDDILTPQHH